jgi:hypothetical protein
MGYKGENKLDSPIFCVIPADNKNKQLGYKGCVSPTSEAEIIPTIKTLISCALENLNNEKEDKISKKDVKDFLEILLECTKIEPGYFYCPKVPIKDNS